MAKLTEEQRLMQRIKKSNQGTQAHELMGLSDPKDDEPVLEQSTIEQDELIEDADDPKDDETQVVSDEQTDVDELIEDTEQSIDYYDIDGEHFTLDQLREFKDGGLRQNDYTKKTQELSEQRKQLEQQHKQLQSDRERLDHLIAHLQVLEQMEGDIDMDQLKKDDPQRYIQVSEQKNLRKDMLQEALNMRSPGNDAVYVENQRAKLVEHHPEWINSDGKGTDAYAQDMKLVDEYFKRHEYTAEDQANIVTAREWNAIITAARAEGKSEKASTVVKKLKQAPKMTKPGKPSTPVMSDLQKAQEQHKKYGTPQTALALQKAKRAAKQR